LAVVRHLEFVVTSESEYCNREQIFTFQTLSEIYTPLDNVVSEILEISRSCILARDGVNTRALCQATGMWHYFWLHVYYLLRKFHGARMTIKVSFLLSVSTVKRSVMCQILTVLRDKWDIKINF